MYTDYFGFQVNPFKAKPDSTYYFPGQSHEEAIAHLRYAVSQEEGFVLITGEKGIGKTTICRYFLQNLDEKIIVLFCPRAEQSPKRLLKIIITDLGITSIRDNMKDYIDALNEFLMQKKVEQKKVVFLFDEAHKFNWDVLEQIRLLSNLETTREKLLQIILIGCPDLSDRLDSYKYRQLRQRMSVTYQLYPLSEHETSQYITHRITLVGRGALIKFDSSAFRHIYRYSKGIPRLINEVCDRVLMAAYKLREKQISGNIAKNAIKELPEKSGQLSKAYYQLNRRKLFVLAGAIVLVISSAIYFIKYSSQEVTPELSQVERKKDVISKKDQIVLSNSVGGQNRPDRDAYKIKSGLNHFNKPKSYSVQVGAFLIRNNAQILMDSLKAKDYRARIDTFIDPKGRTWYTVRVGKYSSREIAREKADSIITKEKIEAIVRFSSQL